MISHTSDTSAFILLESKRLKKSQRSLSFTMLSNMTLQKQRENDDFKPTIKDYVLQSHIQNGSSSTVFSAVHTLSNTCCTVKCIYKVCLDRYISFYNNHLQNKDRIPVSSWKRDIKSRKTIPSELFFITRLQHKNIIEFFTQFEDDIFIYLVMYASNNTTSQCTFNQVIMPSLVKHESKKEYLPTSPQSITSFNTDSFKSNDAYKEACLKTIDGFTFNTFHHTHQRIKSVFKQLVKGVAYMHSQQIIHNDLKLENVPIFIPLIIYCIFLV